MWFFNMKKCWQYYIKVFIFQKEKINKYTYWSLDDVIKIIDISRKNKEIEKG